MAAFNPRLLEQLRQIVGSEHLVTTAEERACYSYDAGGRSFPPAAVAFPGSVEEVSGIMRLASTEKFPVIPRGAGTGMTGGALPTENSLLLAMSRLNRILEIDRENQVAVVEPGVITGQFQAEVERLGLFYPPDPASRGFCTMGGNVAECAGGPRAVKYGVTRDYILGLEAVLPNGAILHTGVRTAKGVAGYDLTRLLVGSEGTLAIITKIIVRLLARPETRETFLVLCGSMAQAARLVSAILNSGILPSTLEYMDKTALAAVRENLPHEPPLDTEALLLIELDGNLREVAIQGERLTGLLADRTAFPDILETRRARDRQEAEELWTARRAISPSLFKLKPDKLSEDVVVPRSRIPELVEFIEQLGRETGLTILSFGHAGDGNMHVNIMLDKQDAQEFQKGRESRDRLFKEVLRLSGTITGEHGIGLSKAAYLPLEIDAATLEVMRAIKRAFDPHNILNPGKIFPVDG